MSWLITISDLLTLISSSNCLKSIRNKSMIRLFAPILCLIAVSLLLIFVIVINDSYTDFNSNSMFSIPFITRVFLFSPPSLSNSEDIFVLIKSRLFSILNLIKSDFKHFVQNQKTFLRKIVFCLTLLPVNQLFNIWLCINYWHLWTKNLT